MFIFFFQNFGHYYFTYTQKTHNISQPINVINQHLAKLVALYFEKYLAKFWVSLNVLTIKIMDKF